MQVRSQSDIKVIYGKIIKTCLYWLSSSKKLTRAEKKTVMQYNKKTFKQWWEFLKLSEKYRSVCELVSENSKDESKFPLRRLLDELEKNDDFKPIEKYMKLLAVYEKFGDVHHDDFEEWWKKYNQPKSVKTKTELDKYKEENSDFYFHTT